MLVLLLKFNRTLEKQEQHSLKAQLRLTKIMISKESLFDDIDPAYKDLLQRGWWENLGLPSWPPEEIPPVIKWWEEEVGAFPSRTRGVPSCVVMLDGSPHSGKSTMSQALEGHFKMGGGLQVDAVNPDLNYFKTPRGDLALRIDYFPSESYLHEDTHEDGWLFMGPADDETAWINSIHYQGIKTNFWGLLLRDNLTRPPMKRLLLGQRSPLDQTVFCIALASHTKDPAYTIPPGCAYRAKEYLQIYAMQSLMDMAYLDACIFIGTSQEEAQARRIKMGRTGGVAFSPFYQDLSAWYGYFIQKVLPCLRRKYGIGYLVLDGTKPIQENFTIIQDYTQKTMDICLP